MILFSQLPCEIYGVMFSAFNTSSWSDGCGGSRAPAFRADELDRFFSIVATSPAYRSLRPEIISRSPWIIQFHAFSTPEQSSGVIHESGPFVKSATVTTSGQKAGGRNSSSWACQGAACEARPALRDHLRHVGRVLHLDVGRYGDGVNVLRYGDGGFYGYHHDFIPRESMPSSQWQLRGPRVVTFMLYLNDVRSGGSTSFMKLGRQVRVTDGPLKCNLDPIHTTHNTQHTTHNTHNTHTPCFYFQVCVAPPRQVTPKAGRALMWANTLSHQPLMREGLTSHESPRTRKGAVKYVATTWLHAFAPPADGPAGCAELRVRRRQESRGSGSGSSGGLFQPPVEAAAGAGASASGASLMRGGTRGEGAGKCVGGILAVDGSVCCAAACGMCGGSDCWTRPGGAASCCTSAIKRAGACCGTPPCVRSAGCSRRRHVI